MERRGRGSGEERQRKGEAAERQRKGEAEERQRKEEAELSSGSRGSEERERGGRGEGT